jgi:hypothetical protein
LLPPASVANRYTVFAPLYAVKVTGRFRVSVLPLGETVVLLRAIEHWLFCNVPLLPTTAAVHWVPASFSRDNVFVARTYSNAHEFVPLEFAVNHTPTQDRLVAPPVSEYCNVKGWLEPVPVLGVTETVDGPPGTVQAPRGCHPVFPPASVANRNTVCVPLYDWVKVTGRFRVSVLPLGETVVLLRAIEHWLFCSVPLPPTAAGIHWLPASFSRNNVFDERTYSNAHELAAFEVAVNHTHTEDKAVAPPVSEYCNANVWLEPVPVLGVTETVDGPPGTVQAPRACHPVLPPASVAIRNTVCVPLYACVKVSGRFRPSVLPLGETVVLLRAIEHWLFCSVPLLPTTAGIHWLPALFSRYKVFVERTYSNAHELAATEFAVNHTQTLDRLAAPPVSEYCKANVCVDPEPELGKTETADGVPLATGTVQAPRPCHPVLLPLASVAIRNTVCVPLYPCAKVSGRFRVSVLPLSETVVPLKLIEHWLFCNEPLPPTTAGIHWLPASFSRYSVFVERTYSNAHELVPLEVAVNHTHTEDRVVAPPVSVYCNAKVWLKPEPVPGKTETADGVPLATGTVQKPRACHPVLLPPASIAIMYTVCVPVYAGANVTGRFRISVLPPSETVVLATLMEHWLFCNEPLVPGVAAIHWLPASFSRDSVFDEWTYSTAHEWVALEVAVNHTQTEDRLAAPPVSEYCKANVCVAPEPELGETEPAEAVVGVTVVTSIALAPTDPPPVTLTWLVTNEGAFAATFTVTVIAG